MNDCLSDLLDKRLILLSGKGGVGKTTLAVSLALAASRLKKRTLIVEMNSTERVAPYFGLTQIGHHEIALAPYLTAINLSVASCFEEYVVAQIRFKKLFDAFFNNKFVTSFLNAIPGFNELLMIGKIFELERQVKNKASGELLYDLIIVDSPATGHGVSTFEVPKIVTEAVRIGPIKNQAGKILDLLTDPKKTAFCVVSLPEEMPVVESTELIASVKKRLGIRIGCLFLNAVYPQRFTKTEADQINREQKGLEEELYPYFAYARLYSERSKLHDYYEKELAQLNKGIECIKLPYVFEPMTKAKDLYPLVEELLGHDHD